MSAKSDLLFVDGSQGAAGDMLLGALVDLGVSTAGLRRAFKELPVDGWTLRSSSIVRTALAGRRVSIGVKGRQPGRGWRDLRRILKKAGGLSDAVRDRSLDVFRRLLEAEADVHGSSFEKVHLHEAGGVDAILDVVGVCWALEQLGEPTVVCSPLTTGFGSVDCAHGRYPVPAPATLALVRGVPVQAGTLEMERLTPTGAALLTTLTARWESMPAMLPARIGYGAGSASPPG
ncbi:MAG: LarC family nickel insertion protein, partial [Acidobacteriota bacterium]|nr:LarC family nickel insertion protein [Acidobacteriota bacterium]